MRSITEADLGRRHILLTSNILRIRVPLTMTRHPGSEIGLLHLTCVFLTMSLHMIIGRPNVITNIAVQGNLLSNREPRKRIPSKAAERNNAIIGKLPRRPKSTKRKTKKVIDVGDGNRESGGESDKENEGAEKDEGEEADEDKEDDTEDGFESEEVDSEDGGMGEREHEEMHTAKKKAGAKGSAKTKVKAKGPLKTKAKVKETTKTKGRGRK